MKAKKETHSVIKTYWVIDHMLKSNKRGFPDIEMRGKFFPWIFT